MDEVDMDRILRSLFEQDRDLFIDWVRVNMCSFCRDKVLVYPDEYDDVDSVDGSECIYRR